MYFSYFVVGRWVGFLRRIGVVWRRGRPSVAVSGAPYCSWESQNCFGILVGLLTHVQ